MEAALASNPKMQPLRFSLQTNVCVAFCCLLRFYAGSAYGNVSRNHVLSMLGAALVIPTQDEVTFEWVSRCLHDFVPFSPLKTPIFVPSSTESLSPTIRTVAVVLWCLIPASINQQKVTFFFKLIKGAQEPAPLGRHNQHWHLSYSVTGVGRVIPKGIAILIAATVVPELLRSTSLWEPRHLWLRPGIRDSGAKALLHCAANVRPSGDLNG